MNDKENLPMDDDNLSLFEQRLREQSLGPRPGNLGKIMYECGYAAGVTASRKRSTVVTTRWQVISLAASVIALLSFSSHFLPTEVNHSDQLGKRNSANATPQQSTEAEPKTAANAWVMHLTRGSQPNQRTADTLRASETLKGAANPGSFIDELESIPFTAPNPPLRPCDFPLFL